MKKNLFLLVLILLLGGQMAEAALLGQIRYHSDTDKLRVVLDLDQTVEYKVASSEGVVTLTLAKSSAGSSIKNVTELENEIINYIGCEKLNDDLKLGFYFRWSAPYQIFMLGDPPRLVMDCSRNFKTRSATQLIHPGVEYFETVEGIPSGHTRSHVLKIDPAKVMVRPSLALPKGEAPSMWESLKDFFATLLEEEPERETSAFSLSRVSEIAAKSKALAAINGMYFAADGRPLGMLMINKELITLPPYERTALAITADNQVHIDTFLTATYFSLKDNTIYEITKINEPRGESDSVLYTPRYGSRTKTAPGGFELTVQKEAVSRVDLKNASIPADGFVLSVAGAPLENLTEKARIGDPVKLHLALVPFSFNTKADLLHLVGGGPRLVKGGKVYVSKFMERFRNDIAVGRAARTAVGVTADNKLLFVAVDGKKESQGLTLEELSNLLLSLGAVEAMNLDGGSSTTMVIGNKVVNQPVTGKERRVSNAILVFPR